MQDTTGQGVSRIQMRIDGHWITVFPTWWVAKQIGYERNTVTQLCEQGALIATKYCGRWWIHEEPLRKWHAKTLPHYIKSS